MEAAASSSAGSVAAPWSVGWQINERNMMWNDDLKLRLIKVHSQLQYTGTASAQQSASAQQRASAQRASLAAVRVGPALRVTPRLQAIDITQACSWCRTRYEVPDVGWSTSSAAVGAAVNTVAEDSQSGAAYQ
jgi:hypothetical protein